VRQLLTESVLLALAGGALGLLIASGAAPLLARLVPSNLPIGEATVLNVRVVAFAAFLIGAIGIGFGVLPALRMGGRSDLSVLRQGAKGGGDRAQRFRSLFVVAQVTASVALLIAAGLLLRALARVQSVDPGFETEGILAIQTPLPAPKYESVELRAQLYTRILSETRRLPGVIDAAYISYLPMVMRGGVWPVALEGLEEGADGSERASLRFVTPGFFSVLGVPLLRGRDVADSDTFESPLVAVVSESFVRRYFPDRDPMGLSFGFAFQERTIVGVVGDVRVRGLEAPSEPQVYLPYRQVPDGGLRGYTPRELVVRASVDSALIVPEIRRIVSSADRDLPIARVRTLQDVIDAETAPRSTQLLVLAVFAGTALLLAAVGIYGLLSFAVSQRSSEIGLRVALGAAPAAVLRMVLGEGLALAAAGAALGALVGLFAGRSMEALLAGVRPTDGATFATAAATAFVMTIAGSILPAIRALRLDPTRALRSE
jgi:predicted permease